MTSSTAFSSRVRDAGDLERDSRLYESFRSIGKYDMSGESRRKSGDQQARRRPSRHEDIFTPDLDLIQPARDRTGSSKEATTDAVDPLPPQPPASSSSGTTKHHKKKRSKPKSERLEGENKDETKSHSKPSSSNYDDDEFMKALRRRTSLNRRRRQNKENDEPEPTTKTTDQANIDLNTSLNRHSEFNSNSEANFDSKKSGRLRSNSLIVKRAFEEPPVDDSKEGGGSGEVEIGVDSNSRRGSKSSPSPLQQQQQPTDRSIDSYFSPLLRSCTRDFVLSPAPMPHLSSNQIVNCKITCHKGLLTEYAFWLDGVRNNGSDLLIMKAHRRVQSAKMYYLITLLNYDARLSYGAQWSEANACARVVSNIYRNKFRLDLIQENERKELLNVSYKSALGEPTKITALASLCGDDGVGKGDKVTYFLKNRTPHYDTHRRQYVLAYNGRAKKSSKHNFQIVDESSTSSQDVLIQVGKMETRVYSCDYAFPLCALQAFGFALSSLLR